jgi:DNA-binding NtrC family response regulator
MDSRVPIVIIDDNPGSLELLSTALGREGVVVYTAQHPARGIELVQQHHAPLVLTDLVMPEMSGLNVLDRIMQIDPTTDVVLMTAHYTTETAVEAIRRGAADYLEKPVKLQLLRERVYRLLEAWRQRQQAASATASDEASFEGIVARSSRMWAMFGTIQRIAPHFRSVLLHGPTGSGKDLVAAAIHRLSGVRGNYVVVNCSAVVETLFESELFGHVKGAFTGADRDKPGLMEHADNGTLFLDEIGDMPLSTQAKLLRAVQNQQTQRVGALSGRKVNVRVVAATHRDLRQAVREGWFREDLYYRLCMVEVEVPALREHLEDLPLLAHHFIAQFARQYGKQILGLTPRAKAVLERYDWPGNVRELENVLGRACMMAAGEWIEAADLPDRILEADKNIAVADVTTKSTAPPRQMVSLPDQEKESVVQALQESEGNQSQAARRLGIGRDALRYKMKKYGLT